MLVFISQIGAHDIINVIIFFISLHHCFHRIIFITDISISISAIIKSTLCVITNVFVFVSWLHIKIINLVGTLIVTFFIVILAHHYDHLFAHRSCFSILRAILYSTCYYNCHSSILKNMVTFMLAINLFIFISSSV